MQSAELKYRKAEKEDTVKIYQLVQNTITHIYPRYYPKEVVDFFLEHHSMERIASDIENGCVYVLYVDNCLAGTGSFEHNHISRVFVSPGYQGNGYGNYIMRHLEGKVAEKHHKVYLDASLPGGVFYEHRGYKTIRHESLSVKNDAVLIYEIMEKEF